MTGDLPVSTVLGSHRDINKVMLGVKHNYIIERSLPDKYIHRAGAAAAGKFNIEHLSVWMPKVRPSRCVQTQLEALLVAGAQCSLYFEQVRVYRNQFGATKLSPTWRVTSVASEQLPRHVFVAFASIKRVKDQQQSNQVFNNTKLTRLSVPVNSRQYPHREIKTNFAKSSENYSRA